MINEIDLINETIIKIGAESRADLNKSALNKDVNKNKLIEDYNKRNEASDKEFEDAKEKFLKAERIHENSRRANALTSLEKILKPINAKLEILGF